MTATVSRWSALTSPSVAHAAPALAVAAQEGGQARLVRPAEPAGRDAVLEKLEEEGGVGGLWLAGDPIETELLGKPDVVPKAENPALASDGREQPGCSSASRDGGLLHHQPGQRGRR